MSAELYLSCFPTDYLTLTNKFSDWTEFVISNPKCVYVLKKWIVMLKESLVLLRGGTTNLQAEENIK